MKGSAPCADEQLHDAGVAEGVGDHQACMWDVVSDLPHVDNGGFLGMLSADAISSPRSVFQVCTRLFPQVPLIPSMWHKRTLCVGHLWAQ